jgi:non-specific serine/threonine protein kinase
LDVDVRSGTPEPNREKGASEQPPEFAQHVRDALRHLHDRPRLQTHPLARYVSTDDSKRSTGRGKTLQDTLLAAVEAMRPAADARGDGIAGRSYQLLVQRYVDGGEAAEVQSKLAIGKTEYYAEHQRAIDAVTSWLWERLGATVPEMVRSTTKSVTPAMSALSDVLPTTRPIDQRPRHNLSVQLTSFVGREEEIAKVRQLLSAHRLVSLTGTGGCGKTRLALQVVGSLVDDYSDGIWYVELAPLADSSLVAPTIAAMLGVQEQPDRPLLTTLVDTLRPKRLLLILDNCEHLIEVAAHLVEALLRGCPTIRILATSREALGVGGEAAWRVPSLPIPPQRSPTADAIDLAALARFDGILLFIERAQLVDPEFALTQANAPIVAQICWRLDGIPLAIELAAARVKMLSVERIAARLDDQFRLLTGGSRTALPRQQTLRATIDWSYALLSESERRLLRSLSVFAGGFTLEAAEAVCADVGAGSGVLGSGGGEAASTQHLAPNPQEDVLDLLTQLVDKSLVQVEKQEGEERYRLLETIRQYGRDRLFDAGEGESVRNRHFDWFVAFAERAEPELIGPRQVAWLDRLELEHDNLRVALAWGLDSRPSILGLRLAAALWRLWHVRDHESEGLDWLRRALSVPGAQAATIARAKALQGVVELSGVVIGGNSAEGLRAAEESLTVCQEIGDQEGAAWSMAMVGRYVIYEADYSRAGSLLEQARVLARQVNARWVLGQVLEGLGELAATRGSLLVARQRFEESLALFRAIGDRRAISSACYWIGVDAGLLGDYATARERLSEALSIMRELRGRSLCCFVLLPLAAFARVEGDYEQSRVFVEECLAIARDIGSRWLNGWGLLCAGWLARDEGDGVRATALTTAALRLSHTAMAPTYIRQCLVNLGILAVETGHVRRGLRLLGASGRMGDIASLLYERLQDDPQAHQASQTAARAALGDREFELAWAEGQVMTLEQAVDYALEASDA